MRSRLLLIVFAGIALFGTEVTVTQTPSGTLLQLSNLNYVGAFKLPEGGTDESNSFEFGGTALAHNPARNSLFLVGHDHHQYVCEISVPEIRNVSNLSLLATATILQRCRDASESRKQSIASSPESRVNIGGLMVWGSQLYASAYIYYDAEGAATRSHFVRPLNLSTTGQVRGMFELRANPGINGNNLTAGFVAKWMVPVPSGWQAALGGSVLAGMCCTPIISRTSWGPAAFAFNPAQLVNPTTPITVRPLLYYTTGHKLAEEGGQGSLWNFSTTIEAAIFPEGSRSLLFLGWQGLGPVCYGPGDVCRDPDLPDSGFHAHPYRAQIWAYDANDLAAVKAGKKQPWQLQPYGVWPLTFPIGSGSFRLTGATYDPVSRRLFVAQGFGESHSERPLIQVFVVDR